ncbi:Signal recognition particle subunit SRP72 [Strongyloides ratti]|uniref:Signal recognition particle subunit SRP72 n=1 Tax=Strongyloides ratti TaxID=34506 RepID=A0A090MYD8_STRRB|nr:Signal recognition particle subunit SRP72 [Strongyloides ratti]CEF67009.1 Signal recognition particle subunit SRP72 [Strongyloides ratti]
MVKKNTPPLMPVSKETEIYEDAYVAYRRFENEKCLELLNKLDQNEIHVMELKAQLLYRLGKYTEASNVYEKLFRQCSDDWEDERNVNYMATFTMQRSIKKITTKINPSLETYEQHFNYACYLIEDENYTEAIKYLEKAQKMCKEILYEDGFSDEEIEEELAIIRVQIAYAYQKMHLKDKARIAYEAINRDLISDSTTLIVLLNNLPTVQEKVNINDTRKKMKSATKLDIHKLNRNQQAVLAFNQAVISHLSKSPEQFKKALESYKSIAGETDNYKLLCIAESLRSKDNSCLSECCGSLKDEKHKFWLNIQSLVRNKDYVGATKYAREFVPSDVKNTLSYAGLLTSLDIFNKFDNPETSLINVALALEKTNKILAKEAYAAAIRISNRYKKGNSNIPVIESLLSTDDKSTIVGLIKALSRNNFTEADEIAKKYLSSINSPSTKLIDVDAIENDDSILYTQKSKIGKVDASHDTDKNRSDDIEKVKKRVHRKRKPKLPKNYDPSKTPDPERWLPKYERTSKKNTSKKLRDKNIGKGSQGVSTGENMDYSNRPATFNNTPQSPPQGPRQQQKNNITKKKKKGRK